jgi:iron(III) transport system ATP-binding protein
MIQLQGVTKSFGIQPAVMEASLALRAGEIATLNGGSGSGKTTLLRLIAGLETPDCGEIHIAGRRASAPGKLLLAPHERGLGMAFQAPALWPHLTVAQNILYGVKAGASARDPLLVERLLEAIEIPGLAGRFPGELSGGQARRVAMARALAPRSPCLLLDEPLVNLQPELRARLLDFTLAWARESGATLLYVTHEPSEVERIPGRRFSMQEGRLDELRSAH